MDSKRICVETSRIHNVFAQQYGFANFGRVFTVIHCETLSWEGLHSLNDLSLNEFRSY